MNFYECKDLFKKYEKIIKTKYKDNEYLNSLISGKYKMTKLIEIQNYFKNKYKEKGNEKIQR